MENLTIFNFKNVYENISIVKKPSFNNVLLFVKP